MDIRVVANYEELSRHAAYIIAGAIHSKPDLVLGLATGSTPVGLYKELIRMHREEGLDFSNVSTFNLDEYIGLPRNHEQSYYTFMHEQFFNHVNIPKHQIHMLNGESENFQQEAEAYEQAIDRAGGIDIQILGIGSNGHIGFNEPGSDPEGLTGVVKLAESTRKSNARFFASINEVPVEAISMGLKTILSKSRRIVLLANGEYKAEAIRKMAREEITPNVPASLLRQHGHVTVIVDEQAAQGIMKEGEPGERTALDVGWSR